MSRIKNLIIAILVVVVAVIIVQNTQEVETRLLFVTVTMPRAVLILLSFLAGAVAALLYASRRPKKAETSK